MVPVKSAKLDLDIDSSNSCNHWMCCFGCKCVREVKKVSPEDSPVSVDTVERIVRTYERHQHTHHTPEKKPRLLRRSNEIEDLSAIRKQASVDVGIEITPRNEESKENGK